MRHSRRSDSEQGFDFSGRRSTADDYTFEPAEKCYCENCKLRGRNALYFKQLGAELQENMLKVLDLLTDQEEEAISDLRELVKFKSISADPSMVSEGLAALDWVLNRLNYLKFRVRTFDITKNDLSCVTMIPKKVLFANYFSSPTKCTLLIYGYVDVLPPQPECWLHDPFDVDLKEDMIYGRGVTNGKGMIIGWLQAIECWLKVNEDLPINVKFIIEMMHEVGSTGLQDYVKEKFEFFLDVDYILFDVNSWMNDTQPVIACSLTGRAYFGLNVRGGNKPVETGLAGGLVFEPLIDLCHLMNKLLDNSQEMNIPLIDHNVKHLTSQDWMLLETSDFSPYRYKDALEIRRLKNEENKVELLRSRWCRPCLTMHGVDGSDARSDCSPSIPMMVTGNFSIKLVPDQEVNMVHSAISEYLYQASEQLNIGTKYTLNLLDSSEPVAWQTDSQISRAVRNAIRGIFNKDPFLTNTIPICLPVANAFHKMVKKPLILLPYYKRLDRHQLENEHINEVYFERHSKVCAAMLFELSKLPVRCKCNIITAYCNLQGVAEKLDALRVKDEEVPEPSDKRRTESIFRVKNKSIYKSEYKKSLTDYLCPSFRFRWRRKSKSQPKRTPRRERTVSIFST